MNTKMTRLLAATIFFFVSIAASGQTTNYASYNWQRGQTFSDTVRFNDTIFTANDGNSTQWDSAYSISINGLVNIVQYGGYVGADETVNEAAIQAAIAAGDTLIYVPRGANFSYNNLTGVNGLVIINANDNSISFGKSTMLTQKTGDSHVALYGAQDGGIPGIWVYPQGAYPLTPYSGGQYSALKLFWDDYDLAKSNGTLSYRDVGYTLNDNGHNLTGAARINSKNNGNYMGAWQDIEFTFQNTSYPVARMMNLAPQNDSVPNGRSDYRFNNNPYWYEGKSVTEYDYVLNDFTVYKALNTGVTGSVRPTHQSGDTSDGGITWRFIENRAPNISGQRFRPVFWLGDFDTSITSDPAIGFNNSVLHLTENGLIYPNVELKFLNGNKDSASVGITRQSQTIDNLLLSGDLTNGTGLIVGRSLISANQVPFSVQDLVKTDGATTVDVSTANVVKFNDTSPTNFTGFTAGNDGQVITCRFNSSNTTLIHNNATLELPNGDNFTPSSRSSYQFLMISATKATMVGEKVMPPLVSSTLDFASTSAQSSSDLTITYTGAVVGDVVALGTPNASVLSNSSFTAWVSAADTVTVRFNNYSTSSQDPSSGTFTVKILR